MSQASISAYVVKGSSNCCTFATRMLDYRSACVFEHNATARQCLPRMWHANNKEPTRCCCVCSCQALINQVMQAPENASIVQLMDDISDQVTAIPWQADQVALHYQDTICNQAF